MMRGSSKKTVWLLCGCLLIGLAAASCDDAQAAHYTHPELAKPPFGPPPCPDDLPPMDGPGAPSDGNVLVVNRVRLRSRILYGGVWVQATSMPMLEAEARQVMGQMHRDLSHRTHELIMLRLMSIETLRSSGAHNFVESLRELLHRAAQAQKYRLQQRQRTQTPSA